MWLVFIGLQPHYYTCSVCVNKNKCGINVCKTFFGTQGKKCVGNNNKCVSKF